MQKLITTAMAALLLVAMAVPGAGANDGHFRGGHNDGHFRGGHMAFHGRDRGFNHGFRNRFFFNEGAFLGGVPFYPYYPNYAQSNWYCSNPPGYYPYVAQCFVPWQAVR